MGEALGLDKEKPNRVTKVAVKMLKCKLSRFSQSRESFIDPLEKEEESCTEFGNRLNRSLKSRLRGPENL